MRTHAPWGKTSLVAAIVAAGILLAGTPVFAEETDASMGTTQGKADARANGWWFLSGLLLPGVGIILPWLFAPSVPSDNLIGKSEEYVASYQKAFVSKVKLGNFLWSVAGCGTMGIAYGVVVICALADIGSGLGTSCGNSLSSSCL